MGKLKHPNIVELNQWFETEKRVYLIMELAKDGKYTSKLRIELTCLSQAMCCPSSTARSVPCLKRPCKTGLRSSSMHSPSPTHATLFTATSECVFNSHPHPPTHTP